jgi:hypothetical protein
MRQDTVPEWLLRFSGAGFSLRGLVLARSQQFRCLNWTRPKGHRLKPMLLNATLTAQWANDILHAVVLISKIVI